MTCRRTLLSLALVTFVVPSVVVAQSWRLEHETARPAIAFGAAIAVAGDEIIVGRPEVMGGFPMPPAAAGAVHIFRRSGAAWRETASVAAPDGSVGDGFGMAVAADGDVLAVGAPRAMERRGLVYVFERDRSGGWTHRATIGADGATGDELGTALAVGRGVVLAGAPGRGGQGAVVTIRRDAGTGAWRAQGQLEASAPAAGQRFGAAISLGGEIAVVGAPGVRGEELMGPPARLRAGAVHVFRQASGGSWTEEARLIAEDTTVRAFGIAALAGDGEIYASSPAADRGAGVVFAFRRQGTEWQPAGRITAASRQRPSMFGAALARAGADLLVGAPFSGQGSGAMHVMRRDAATGTWSEAQVLTGGGGGLGPQFGSAVAARGDVAATGAPGGDFFEGVAYVYGRDGASAEWRQVAAIADSTPSPLAAVTGGEMRCAESKAGAFDCRDVDLVSFLPNSALGAKRGIMLNDLWGWTDAETGREFAIVGRLDGTSFVEVTDPANPRYLGDLPLHEGARPNLWRDMKVYRNHAFIVSDGAGPHGVQIFDLTQLRSVREPRTFTETAHYDRIHSAHNIAIDDESGFAYTIGNSMGGETCGGGPHMIDIRDPVRPTFAGCWADTTTGRARTGYTHDAQCVVYKGPDERYRGRQLCFNASENALGIADVTDKQNPKRISSASYPNVAYAHQGWLSDDHQFFFLNDEGDELSGTAPRTRTIVFDVRDLDDPIVAKEFFGTTPATDHNLYVRGRYMYQSNYVAGLRVIDVTNPIEPVEVGFLDTVPFGEIAPGFAGTWSNYPFFRSGVVAVTSMREGLFLVRYRPTHPVP
ncbi:MAG TPA: choice-of-anchor B family protein [Gemmatimonadaceae bacterium]|nr:choice-of-anchor B family protein [Gemmatimonadaceae bacterium]